MQLRNSPETFGHNANSSTQDSCDICRSEESAEKDSMALSQKVKNEKITTSGKNSEGNKKERNSNCT